jgi:ammonium transporter, Amt family
MLQSEFTPAARAQLAETWRVISVGRIGARLLVAAVGFYGMLIGNASASVPAQATLDSGATAWVLTASALVLFMTLPGLTLFYGGLVRTARLPAVLMRRCFAISCVVSLVWLAFGYSFVFAPGGSMLGSLDAGFLNGAVQRILPSGLPEGAIALFQMTFAIITPALIIGAIAERARFSFVLLFSAIWTILVYLPVAHWVWSADGWLAERGTLDFAGGIVVHTTAGVSALVAAWLVGPRDGFPHRIAPPHDPAMTTVGAAMLWVGWFGFNGGSALAANASAASTALPMVAAKFVFAAPCNGIFHVMTYLFTPLNSHLSIIYPRAILPSAPMTQASLFSNSVIAASASVCG